MFPLTPNSTGIPDYWSNARYYPISPDEVDIQIKRDLLDPPIIFTHQIFLSPPAIQPSARRRNNQNSPASAGITNCARSLNRASFHSIPAILIGYSRQALHPIFIHPAENTARSAPIAGNTIQDLLRPSPAVTRVANDTNSGEGGNTDGDDRDEA